MKAIIALVMVSFAASCGPGDDVQACVAWCDEQELSAEDTIHCFAWCGLWGSADDLEGES